MESEQATLESEQATLEPENKSTETEAIEPEWVGFSPEKKSIIAMKLCQTSELPHYFMKTLVNLGFANGYLIESFEDKEPRFYQWRQLDQKRLFITGNQPEHQQFWMQEEFVNGWETLDSNSPSPQTSKWPFVYDESCTLMTYFKSFSNHSFRALMQSEEANSLIQKSMLNALDHVFSQRLEKFDENGFLNSREIGAAELK